MKIIFISYSFNIGGAAIAAEKFAKIAGTFSDIKRIEQAKAGSVHLLKRLTSYVLSKMQYGRNPIKHSLNLFSYFNTLNTFKENDVFHIHWINNDTLSIFDFDKIPKGSIITLHDEWLYCGAEHYYNVEDSNKPYDFITGYTFFKKGIWGVHWNYIVWKVKFKKLSRRSDLIYTVPSEWMLSRSKQSLILKGSDVRLLPNPIDTDIFHRQSQNKIAEYRQSIGLDADDIVLAFGAIGGKSNFLKGAHLLDEALSILSKDDGIDHDKIKLINFGGKSRGEAFIHNFENISLGHISEQSKLVLLYSSVDCVVVPSLVESFGQVAAEAEACETPVISFNCSGLMDIVLDGRTGLTAKPFSAQDLANKVKEFILLDQTKRDLMGCNGRKHIVKNFSYPVVEKIYKKIISDASKLKTISKELNCESL